MKKIINTAVLVIIIFLFHSCDKEDDTIYTNTILVNGELKEIFSGALISDHTYISPGKWEYAFDLIIFGDGIEYRPSKGFSGKGLLLVAKLHCSGFDFEGGTYIYDNSEDIYTFNQAAYSNNFDTNSNNNTPVFFKSGTIKISPKVSVTRINFDLTTEGGERIKGVFENGLIGFQ